MSHSVLAEAIDSKISSLKRGKAEVIEAKHVLILGWSSKIVKLLQELCLAERYQVTALVSCTPITRTSKVAEIILSKFAASSWPVECSCSASVMLEMAAI